MSRRAAAAVCALTTFATLAIVAGCSPDSARAPDASASSDATTTTTTTTSTTVPPTLPLAPAASPQKAATAFVNAWHDGDRLAASAVALPAAVDAVFAAGEPGSLENRGCNRPPPDSPVLCVYKTAVGEVQLRIQLRPDGWIVEQAIVSPA